MKQSEWSVFENGAARLARRVIQSRFDTQKPPAHRYQRRKVREYLRQVEWTGEGEMDARIPASVVA
jgi:hypothetical protein